MRNQAILLFFTFLLFLGGCSEKESNSETKQKNIQEEKAEEQVDKVENESLTESDIFKGLPEIPMTTLGVVDQVPGKYANQTVFQDGVTEKVKEEIKDIPPLPENPTEQEYKAYFKYIYSLAANDFQDPDDLVKKWEFSMFGSSDLNDPKYQFKDNYNVEIILDSSGSMGAVVDGKTQMQLAKEAINEFVGSLPEDVNISLRVYGHKGTGDESDKQKSCSSIEQVYGFEKYKSAAFNAALEQFQPSGWTPIAKSLEESFESFKKYDQKTNSNLIYLVSDGIETCNGDPLKIAEEFADSNVSPIINVIGFNVDSQAQKQLKGIANSSNGIYTTVGNKEQLTNEFDRAQEVLLRWESWKENALIDLESQDLDNKLDISVYSNDWNFLKEDQSLRINEILTLLREQGKINFDNEEELQRRSSDVMEVINKAYDEIVNDLNSTNKEGIESLKESINQKYNKQVE
ncbi:VWA domain-containing protein [[Bacillus] enclensis]|jgi:Ca-activated chloride channel homolog|uniref:VWA domain-containing protein n=1 Tax=[Bacillus] enclensis TaxID=1402860 RepID=UPI0018DE8760|nr:VWA domain-containing protein [[Bacillus] enclensis]MBH9968490.1 VWA domain-containing protein [[Bacillus] enclensis]